MTGPGNRRPSVSRTLAIVLVSLVVVAAVVLAATRLFGPHSKAPEPSQPISPSAPSAPPCPSGKVVMSGTVDRAPTAVWSVVGTMAAPSTGSAGPHKTSPDGFRRCFARTPEGALVAAANFTAMMSDPDLMDTMARGSVVSGKGRDAAIAKRFGASASANPAGGASVQIAGFQIAAYDGRTALVNLALRVAGSGTATVPWKLQWSDGDWKFQVADDGELLYAPTALGNMSAYVSWGTS